MRAGLLGRGQESLLSPQPPVLDSHIPAMAGPDGNAAYTEGALKPYLNA